MVPKNDKKVALMRVMWLKGFGAVKTKELMGLCELNLLIFADDFLFPIFAFRFLYMGLSRDSKYFKKEFQLSQLHAIKIENNSVQNEAILTFGKCVAGINFQNRLFFFLAEREACRNGISMGYLVYLSEWDYLQIMSSLLLSLIDNLWEIDFGFMFCVYDFWVWHFSVRSFYIKVSMWIKDFLPLWIIVNFEMEVHILFFSCKKQQILTIQVLFLILMLFCKSTEWFRRLHQDIII